MSENLRTVDSTGSGQRKEVKADPKIETHCDNCNCAKGAKLVDARK